LYAQNPTPALTALMKQKDRITLQATGHYRKFSSIFVSYNAALIKIIEMK